MKNKFVKAYEMPLSFSWWHQIDKDGWNVKWLKQIIQYLYADLMATPDNDNFRQHLKILSAGAPSLIIQIEWFHMYMYCYIILMHHFILVYTCK